MPIRITGLNSGLDTEAIISALVSSYNYKTNKYKKAQTKLSWKQDAWKSLNTKIYSLYNNVGNMRLSSSYNLKKTTVSDNTKVSISAGSGSVNGSYSVQVTSIAKAGYLTGGKLAEGTKGTTKLSALGFRGTDAKLSVKVGDKTTDITVNKDTTINNVVSQLKEAGVNASYDEANRRFYVSSNKTGAENDFSLVGTNEAGSEVLAKLGLSVNTKANTAYYTDLAKYAGLDKEAVLEARNTAMLNVTNAKATIANSEKVLTYAEAVSGIREVEDKLKEKGYADTEIDLFKTLAASKDLEKSYVDGDGNIFTYNEETKTYQNAEKGEVNEEAIKAEDSGYTKASDKLKEMADTIGLTEEEGLAGYRSNLSTVRTIYDSADDTLKTELDKIEDPAQTQAAISEHETIIETQNQYIEEQNAIIEAYPLITDSMTDQEFAALQEKAAYAQKVVTGQSQITYSADATRIEGADATIYVNGVEYTGTSNSFAINGMTITASAVTNTTYDPTEKTAVNVTVDTDVQGVYDKIKDFLSQYNALINEMTSLYNADSAKGYEPLTDEEKDAMSDKEVEKWEEKVKSALLRRDTTLSGVMSAMTQAMAKGIQVNGKTMYLSDFGIKTMGYLNAAKNEQNAYHIDGDEDDVNTSGKADKLMAAIAADPDSVVEFMQGLTKNLYSEIDSKMKSTELSSIYTVYNDKEMASEYSDYTSIIKKWEEKLKDQEDYYYKKFSAMESALAKLNSQTSSLTGLFGGGN